MASDHSTFRLASPFWRAFLLLLGAFSLIPNVMSLFYFLDYAGQHRFRDVDLGVTQWQQAAEWGACSREVRALAPNSTYARFGGKIGDRVCYSTILERYPYITTAEVIELRVIGSDGQTRQLSIPTKVRELEGLAWVDGVGQPVQDILFALVGMLIGWRGAQQTHLRRLALGMLLWSLLMPFYVPRVAQPWLDLLALLSPLNLLAFISFALAAPELRVVQPRSFVALLRRAAPAYGLLCVVGVILAGAVHFLQWQGQAQTLVDSWRLATTLIGYVALVSLLFAYRALAHGVVIERLDLLLPIFCLSLLVQLQPGLYAFFPELRVMLVVAMEYLLATLLPLGLAYAVLRHRVFDLGFALNRVIFFSLFTLSLAIGIGFAEFTVKLALHHINWLQKYKIVEPIISALLGIAVILGFRHIHHWLENLVENLFFHDWHVSAEHFRQQVARIAHVGDDAAVLRAYVDALHQFAMQAKVAIFLQHDLSGGAQKGLDDFHLQYSDFSTLTANLDANDGLAVALRAGARVQEIPLQENDVIDEGINDLPVLALALQVRGRVFGLVLVGLKSDGHRYRPDEIKIMCQASDEIALDLESLRVAQMQRQLLAQQQANEKLTLALEVARLQGELQRATPAMAE